MAYRDLENDRLPLPNGWFGVAFSRDLQEGEVKPLRYFGQELVLFRTRAGHARVLDPFCPHLGAHVGYGGRVIGETIRCPFHAWQYDGESGACTHIPYCERIPPRAKLRPWEVQEKNGLIWVWHHAEHKPPEWDFPTQPEFESDEWSEPRIFDLVMEAPLQDTHENNSDPVHFQFVHGMSETPPTEVHFSSNSNYYRITSRYNQPQLGGALELLLVRESWGLGLATVRTEGLPGAGLLMYASTTPIDETRVHSRWQLTCTKNMVDVAGEEFMKGLTEGVLQDIPIWKNKVHRTRPLLCEADTDIAAFRKWARQFYSSPTPGEKA